jgi:hypothetical protein
MTRIPLIIAEGVVAESGAVEDAEGRGVVAGRGAEQGIEGYAKQDAETARGEGAERTGPAEENPASEVERVVVAEHAALAVGASPEANAVNAEGASHAPVAEVNENTRGPTGGDAEDEAHTAELEAALLVVSSPGCKTRAEDAGAVKTGIPSATAAEAEV